MAYKYCASCVLPVCVSAKWLFAVFIWVYIVFFALFSPAELLRLVKAR
jgi:hypothetical protein